MSIPRSSIGVVFAIASPNLNAVETARYFNTWSVSRAVSWYSAQSAARHCKPPRNGQHHGRGHRADPSGEDGTTDRSVDEGAVFTSFLPVRSPLDISSCCQPVSRRNPNTSPYRDRVREGTGPQHRDGLCIKGRCVERLSIPPPDFRPSFSTFSSGRSLGRRYPDVLGSSSRPRGCVVEDRFRPVPWCVSPSWVDPTTNRRREAFLLPRHRRGSAQLAGAGTHPRFNGRPVSWYTLPDWISPAQSVDGPKRANFRARRSC